jgi:hypothetical protein
MTTTKLTLEDYLRNPVNLEEADEQSNGESEKQLVAAQEALSKAGHGPVSDYDRKWLKRLQFEPGYLILFRMLNNIVLRFENSATVLSQGDPLGNAAEVAKAWAYAAMARGVKEQLEKEITQEIAQAE